MAETLINKTQAGEGLWHQDNLVAGTNISITQVEKPVIDENTLGVWHFDGNTDNAVSGNDVTITSSIPFSYGTHSDMLGFGQYAMPGSSATNSNLFQSNLQISSGGNWTVDCWVNVNWAGNNAPFIVKTNTTATPGFMNGSNMQWSILSMDDIVYVNQAARIYELNKWYHLAIENYGQSINYFVNGVLMAYSKNTAYGRLVAPTNMGIDGSSRGNYRYDELRISNVARYQGQDFTPYAEPYAAAGGPAQYQINNTKADPDLSSYLQNTATGTDAVTINGIDSGRIRVLSIGSQSEAYENSCAIGAYAFSKSMSVAIGTYANCDNSQSIAIGSSNGTPLATKVTGTNSVAIGFGAKVTNNYAIQLGSGTNSTANTFQVFNTTVVDANGKIPMTSTDVTSLTGYDATKTQVLKNVNGTLTWVDEA